MVKANGYSRSHVDERNAKRLLPEQWGKLLPVTGLPCRKMLQRFRRDTTIGKGLFPFWRRQPTSRRSAHKRRIVGVSTQAPDFRRGERPRLRTARQSQVAAVLPHVSDGPCALPSIRRQPGTADTVILGKKLVIRQMAVAIARILGLQAIEEEHLMGAFVLGLDSAA
jgi:hypothetical protein